MRIQRYSTVILLSLVALILAPLAAPVYAADVKVPPIQIQADKPETQYGFVDYSALAPRDKSGNIEGPDAPIYAIVNKSGTMERNGVIQVRLDLCLAPGAYRYDDARFYNSTGDNTWAKDRVFHTHFIYINPLNARTDTIAAAMALHLPNFYAAWLANLDIVQHGMRHGWQVDTRLTPVSYTDSVHKNASIIAASSLATTAVKLDTRGTVTGELFPATDIDIGSNATDRSASHMNGYTFLSVENLANDNGTIDTIEIWANSALSGCKVGTFSGAGTSFTPRGNETIGVVVSGSKQSFTGLSIDVLAGDRIGYYTATGYVEADTTGGAGLHYKSGDQFSAGTQTYTALANYAISVYGTGNTGVVITPPTIDTLAATNIANSTAQVNAYVSGDGNETCDVRFEYGTVTETYTNATAWVNDTYITGDYPYAELTDLASATEYFFRAVIANSNTTAYGSELSFTTASGLSAPTSFKAIESANSVSLSWVKGAGSTSTVVRGKIGSFPTSSTDGTLVYSGTGGTATHENLVAGATYCYSCYASSGGATSEDSADVKATVDLADVTVTETPGAPDTPSTWWIAIDTTVLEDLPLYNEIDGVIDDYGVQSDTGWMFIVLVIVLILSAAAFGMSDGNIMVTGLAAAFLLLAFSLVHLLPLWMMGISIIMFISLAAMRERV